MRTMLSGIAMVLVLGPAAAGAQPAVVVLGPAGEGSREIGVSYSAWAIDFERTASAGSARYTYNFSQEVGIEGGLEVGSAASRPFAVGSLHVRIMRPPRPFEGSRFLTFGVLRAAARNGSPMPDAWGRSFGFGMQTALSGSRAIRFDVQYILFGKWRDPDHGGVRLAFSIVSGRD